MALARFYHRADNLNRLSQEQRVALARRIAAAHARGVGEETLRDLAVKGAAQDDRAAAIHAADGWLRGAQAA